MTQLTVTPSDRKSQQHSVSLVFGLFVFVVVVVSPLQFASPQASLSHSGFTTTVGLKLYSCHLPSYANDGLTLKQCWLKFLLLCFYHAVRLMIKQVHIFIHAHTHTHTHFYFHSWWSISFPLKHFLISYLRSVM